MVVSQVLQRAAWGAQLLFLRSRRMLCLSRSIFPRQTKRRSRSEHAGGGCIVRTHFSYDEDAKPTEWYQRCSNDQPFILQLTEGIWRKFRPLLIAEERLWKNDWILQPGPLPQPRRCTDDLFPDGSVVRQVDPNSIDMRLTWEDGLEPSVKSSSISP